MLETYLCSCFSEGKETPTVMGLLENVKFHHWKPLVIQK
jgi:hypothetical protein